MRAVGLSSALAVAFAVTLATGLASSAGCKGSTVYKDNPDTVAKLDALEKQVTAQKAGLDQCDKDRADAARAAVQPGEIVVTIEGDALVVKPHTGGGGEPAIPDAVSTKESQAFLDIVSKSRGAIQKCYEQALKKNTGLQARTVSLKISASFSSTGDFTRTSFNPSLGDTFDACLRNVASKWKIPAPPAAMTFQANVSLSPT